MTAWIIGPTISNTNTTTGFTAGAGLSFGVGLILGFSGFTGILFSGQGSVAPTTIAAARNSAALPGAGGLSVLLFGPQGTNPATLPGAGGYSVLVSLGLTAPTTFPGTSSLTANAAKFISMAFAGAGNLSALTTQNMLESGNVFKGVGLLSVPPAGGLLATVTLAGAGKIGGLAGGQFELTAT